VLDRLEARITMPEGAAPLASYARYYARHVRGEIVGTYLRIGNEVPGRRWVSLEELPQVADGGCDVITVIADVRGTVRSAACNGEA